MFGVIVMKKRVIFTGLIGALALGVGVRMAISRQSAPISYNRKTAEDGFLRSSGKLTSQPENYQAVTSPVIAAKKYPALSTLPFYSQAPLGVWDALHEDACEEAALLMVSYWLKGEHPSIQTHEANLVEMVRWEEDRGYGGSITADQTIKIADQYLGISLRKVELKSGGSIKEVVDSGLPIIILADGKKLHNPHFKNGGPVYHALVILGLRGDTVTTNDPGTRIGQGYEYSVETILGAIADWKGRAVASDIGLTLE